jgi:argininosuccinate synthase
MAVAALAFSGGLDTSFAVLALVREGYDVVTVTVDTGGFTPAQLSAIAQRARAVGAKRHAAVDARQEVFDRFFSHILRGNVLRGGVYPVAVGAERHVQAEHLLRVAREEGAVAVAHGSTGAGNDQIRFDVAIRALAPDLRLLAPIRAKGVAREEAAKVLEAAGVPVPAKTTRYSINAGLVGTTVGGGDTHDPWATIPEEAFEEAGSRVDPDAPEREVTIGFTRGLPSSLDGAPGAPLDLISEIDARARPLGVGRGVHLGDTILGIKGRIGFVAPAATVLIAAHRELEKLVLTKRQRDVKDHVGALYGDLLHEGLYLDPVCRDLERLIESSQERVTGEARVRLRRLGCDVLGVRSPHALMAKGARYGEGSSLWDGRDAEGFARIYGIAARLAEESR